MAGELLERHGSVAEVELPGHERHEILFEQVLHPQAGIVDRFGDHRLSELALGHLGREPLRRGLVDEHVHAGGPRLQRRDHRRREPAADRADDAQRGVAGFEPAQHRDVLAECLDLAADAPGPVEHHGTELGCFGAPAVAHEQRNAQLILELAHDVGHIRLHGVEHIGSRGERPPLVDGEHRVEVAELHQQARSVGDLRTIGHSDGLYRLELLDR